MQFASDEIDEDAIGMRGDTSHQLLDGIALDAVADGEPAAVREGRDTEAAGTEPAERHVFGAVATNASEWRSKSPRVLGAGTHSNICGEEAMLALKEWRVRR